MRRNISDSHATSYRDGSGDWRDEAACHGADPEMFFPVASIIGRTPKAGRPEHPDVAKAKAYCRRCPVISECLADAIDTGEKHGIRGGMTEDERRLFREQLKLTKKRVTV